MNKAFNRKGKLSFKQAYPVQYRESFTIKLLDKFIIPNELIQPT